MSVLIETSKGDFVIDLLVEEAPRSCLNFLKLCKIKYYNHSAFTVFPTYTQTGHPTSPSKPQTIFSLLSPNLPPHMAKETVTSDPQTRGSVCMVVNESVVASEFLICFDRIEYLKEHTVFGTVVEGMDTVISEVECAYVDESGNPYQDIRIKHIVILDDPFPDPDGLAALIPDASPPPPLELLVC